MIEVKLEGFDEGTAELRRAHIDFPEVVTEVFVEFAEEAIQRLQASVRGGEYGPAKKRDDGKPPLLDTGVYIGSYKAAATGTMQVDIWPEGDNTFVSNYLLSEMLEYGTTKMPARPHIRPTLVWIEQMAPTKIGDKVFKKLFG